MSNTYRKPVESRFAAASSGLCFAAMAGAGRGLSLIVTAPWREHVVCARYCGGGLMKVGTVFGIPVRLHWSFSLLIVGSVLGALATGGVQTAMQNTLFLGGLFLCVLFHEFGHALMARRFEVATEHVTLYPFGGIAALRGLPKNPAAEFWIALAGPAVNMVFVVVGAIAWGATSWTPALVFTGINLVMGAFNLIPAFPMDGGRVLRASLAPVFGWVKASRLAIGLGRIFALIFVGSGVWFVSVNLLFVGAFLLFATFVEGRRLRQLSRRVHAAHSKYAYVPKWRLHPRT